MFNPYQMQEMGDKAPLEQGRGKLMPANLPTSTFAAPKEDLDDDQRISKLTSIMSPASKVTATSWSTCKNGTLEQCDLQIVESPRFFEAMLRGRPYTQASHITSRICGICAIGHATASLRATETALRSSSPSRPNCCASWPFTAKCSTATFCTSTC